MDDSQGDLFTKCTEVTWEIRGLQQTERMVEKRVRVHELSDAVCAPLDYYPRSPGVGGASPDQKRGMAFIPGCCQLARSVRGSRDNVCTWHNFGNNRTDLCEISNRNRSWTFNNPRAIIPPREVREVRPSSSTPVIISRPPRVSQSFDSFVSFFFLSFSFQRWIFAPRLIEILLQLHFNASDSCSKSSSKFTLSTWRNWF